MPRAAAPNWRQRKEPILDSHLMASINLGADEEGHYGELVYTGCESEARAREIKQALHRSAYHLKCAVTTKIEKAGKTWNVRYHAIAKETARRYVVERYGTDRSAWPYNPRARA